MGRFEGWVVFGWAGSAGEGPDLGQVVHVTHQALTNWRTPPLVPLPPQDGSCCSRARFSPRQPSTRNARTPVGVMSLRSKIIGTKCKLGLPDVQGQGRAGQGPMAFS